MNGAESLIRTLLACGVDTCFTNPGTSEMHFVAALDRVEGMRCVLALFEGVVTGAADGYGRMKDRPASTLLHLGSGLSNGLASLHNARRAMTPIVNVVGEHAMYHRRYDPPLTSDIEGIARAASRWVKTTDFGSVAADAAAAVAGSLAPPGTSSTLVLPADVSWSEAEPPATLPAVRRRAKVDDARVRAAADALRKGRGALVLNGPMLRAGPLDTCGRISAATAAELLCPTQVNRIERGAGRVSVDRIPYVPEAAIKRLAHLRSLVLINSSQPVLFFAYPDKPSLPMPEGCEVIALATPEEDGVDAAQRLAEMLGARELHPRREQLERPGLPKGPITFAGIAAVIAALLPENAIVADESITSGRGLVAATKNAPPHDWLVNPGGAIGFAMPNAIGASVACPDRKVLCLQSDGAGMYVVQSLWTMAREQLDITTVVFANRTYEILKGEFRNVGAGEAGRKARDMLEIGRPDIDWVKLAAAQGVEATRAEDLDSFARELAAALRTKGPRVVELRM
jgi:acetolactate synthase-1/2/3 large subunit